MATNLLNAIMEKYATGDDAAFAELYDALAPRLYGFLLRQTRNQALAEDLLQQTLLSMHRARGRYVPGADVLPWAFAIARRLLIDWHRAHHREVLPGFADERPGQDEVAHDADMDSFVHTAQMARTVEQALAALPESQRTAYQLLRQEGLSLRDAAQALGTTVGAVKLRVHRAYEALRRALESHGATS